MYTGQKPHLVDSSIIRHTQSSLVIRGRLLVVRLCLLNELPIDVSDKHEPQGRVVGVSALDEVGLVGAGSVDRGSRGGLGAAAAEHGKGAAE